MIIIAVLALLIPAVLLRAWVITWMWLWFAVPFGLPAIGMAWAVGISSFVAMFNGDTTSKGEGDAFDKFAQLAGRLFVSPLLALGMGWIAHLAMGT